MSSLRINIHGQNDRNIVIDKEYPKFEDASTRLIPEGGFLASKNVRIVFEPSSIKDLFESISWGANYRIGDVEQAGILIGNYFRDQTGGDEVIWGDVVRVIPADPTLVKATVETIEITTEAWEKMHDDALKFRPENLLIIGWYHTHLNDINTRFSGLDRKTQREAFPYEYAFGVVFNPNQEKWSAFYGPESRECIGELLFDEELSQEYAKSKIQIKQVFGDSELQANGRVIHLDKDGQPVENRPVSPRGAKSTEDDILSLRQLVGQFFSGIGQLMMKPKQREARQRGESPLPPKSPLISTKERNVVLDSQHRIFSDRNATNVKSPKIEIGNWDQTRPKIDYKFYSFHSTDQLVEQPISDFVISVEAIEEIIRFQQVKKSKFWSLWGLMTHRGKSLELSHTDESDANTRIVFTDSIYPKESIEHLVKDLQTIKKESICFVVLIDQASPQCIDIRVINYNRENRI